MKLIGTLEASRLLKVNRSRVRVFIREGRLPGYLVGGQWMINPEDVAKMPPRKSGAPVKSGAVASHALHLPRRNEAENAGNNA